MMIASVRPVLVFAMLVAPAFAQDGVAKDQHERERYVRIADRHFGRIASTFQLDAKMQGWLREELNRRVEATLESTRQTSALSAQLMETKRDQNKSMEIMRQLQEHSAKRPLSVEQISLALKPMLPLEQWQAGHDRLLREPRPPLENGAPDAAAKVPEPIVNLSPPPLVVPADLTREPLHELPPGPQKHQPLLQDAVPTPTAPRFVTQSPARPPKDPGNPQPAPQKSPPPAVAAAPPSDWERLVRDTAARYKFTDVQMRTARSILKDCERRAAAYRKVHAADFARVAKVPDAAPRTAAKTKLDAPINAIGQELRERLEQIPNAQQRAAAATPPTSPKRR